MSEWQPIETAPKDGTEVLLFFVSDVPWQASSKGICIGFWGDDGSNAWYAFESDSNALGNPTHWMPLPPPPEGSET